MNSRLLILDLDETLGFATEEKLARGEDFRLGPYFVYKRSSRQFYRICVQLLQGRYLDLIKSELRERDDKCYFSAPGTARICLGARALH